MNFNAPILVIVPPRTAAGSRSDPRPGLGVIYGDFGGGRSADAVDQAASVVLVNWSAPQPTLSGADDKSRPVATHRRVGALTRSAPCVRPYVSPASPRIARSVARPLSVSA